MTKVKLVNRVRTPLSTIKLAQNDRAAMNLKQVSNLFNLTNPLTKEPFEIQDMDELFYQCNLCFYEKIPSSQRKELAEKLCYAMGYSPSTKHLLMVRDYANNYISHKYFNSKEKLKVLRNTSLPVMDVRELIGSRQDDYFSAIGD